jgi:DNA-binding NtrC family response regulator
MEVFQFEPMSKTVLIVSYNPELLSPHKQILTEVGYEVRECGSLSAALGAVGPGKTDLMVLSPDIPAGDRRRMEAEAKRRNQNIRIVLFCEGEKVKDVFASATLLLSEAPAALIETAGRLLSS